MSSVTLKPRLTVGVRSGAAARGQAQVSSGNARRQSPLMKQNIRTLPVGFDDGEDSFPYVDVGPFVDNMSDECAEMVRLHGASENMLLYREQSHCHVAVVVGRGTTECCRWCY